MPPDVSSTAWRGEQRNESESPTARDQCTDFMNACNPYTARLRLNSVERVQHLRERSLKEIGTSIANHRKAKAAGAR